MGQLRFASAVRYTHRIGTCEFALDAYTFGTSLFVALTEAVAVAGRAHDFICSKGYKCSVLVALADGFDLRDLGMGVCRDESEEWEEEWCKMEEMHILMSY
jgi:hypothetical protein